MRPVNLIHALQTASETSCITYKTAGKHPYRAAFRIQGSMLLWAESKGLECPVEKQRCMDVTWKNAGARLPAFNSQIDMFASSLKLNQFLSASVSSPEK